MKHERFQEGCNRYTTGRGYERYSRGYSDDRCVYHERNYIPCGPRDGYYLCGNGFEYRNCDHSPYHLYNEPYEPKYTEYPHNYSQYREYIPQHRNYCSHEGSYWPEDAIYSVRTHGMRQRDHWKKPIKVQNNYKKVHKLEAYTKRDSDLTPGSNSSIKSSKTPTQVTRRTLKHDPIQLDSSISITTTNSSSINDNHKMNRLTSLDSISQVVYEGDLSKIPVNNQNISGIFNKKRNIGQNDNMDQKIILNGSKLNKTEQEMDDMIDDNNNNINNINTGISISNNNLYKDNNNNNNNSINDNDMNNISTTNSMNTNNNINNVNQNMNYNIDNMNNNNQYIKNENENVVMVQRATKRGRKKGKIGTGKNLPNKLVDIPNSKPEENNVFNNDENINVNNRVYDVEDNLLTNSDITTGVVLRQSTLRQRLNRTNSIGNTSNLSKISNITNMSSMSNLNNMSNIANMSNITNLSKISKISKTSQNQSTKKESIDSTNTSKNFRETRKSKRKMIKSESILSDSINLNKMITRNAENFYQSQLKLAIEMSMKDIGRTNENQEVSSGLTTERIMEVLSDLESELGEVKNRKKIQKTTNINTSTIQKKTKGNKPTTGLKRGPKPRKKIDEILNTNYNNNNNLYKDNNNGNINMNSNFNINNNNSININNMNNISSNSNMNTNNNINNNHNKIIINNNNGLVETNQQLQTYDYSNGKINTTEIYEQMDENMLTKMKVNAFEEYLSISERLYCGRTLVEDFIINGINKRSKVNGKINNNDVKQKLGDKENIEFKQDRLENNNNMNNNNGNNNNTNNNNNNMNMNRSDKDNNNNNNNNDEIVLHKDRKSLNIKQNQDSEEILKFNCSKLDLIYRVSFNILKSPLRQPEIIDLWGPKELILFELGLFKYGKVFHEIQREIPSKSVKEIVDMYYLWKKTNRYKIWKANRRFQINTNHT